MRRLAIAILVSSGGAALACGNPVFISTSRATRLVAEAEKALELDQPKQALKLLPSPPIAVGGGPMFELEDTPPGAIDPGLNRRLDNRLQLLRATAWLRTGQHKAALGWFEARSLLDSPEAKARRAEALSFVAGRRDEAVKILDELVKADLMPDAFAWRTLATLRHAAHDEAGAKEAITRCQAIAKVPTICGGAGARGKPPAGKGKPAT